MRDLESKLDAARFNIDTIHDSLEQKRSKKQAYKARVEELETSPEGKVKELEERGP